MDITGRELLNAASKCRSGVTRMYNTAADVGSYLYFGKKKKIFFFYFFIC